MTRKKKVTARQHSPGKKVPTPKNVAKKKASKKKAAQKKSPPTTLQAVTRSHVAREVIQLAPDAITVMKDAMAGKPVANTQWGAAKLVLDKVVPNLKSIEVAGQLEVEETITERIVVEFAQ